MLAGLLNILSPFLLTLVAALTFVAVATISWFALRAGRHFWEDYESVFKETASSNLADMFLFVDPQRLFFFNILINIIAPLLVWALTGNLLYGLITLGGTLFLPFYAYAIIRKRRFKAFEKQLPDALTMIAGALKAGASINMALESLVKEQPAPLSQEFQLFLREQRIGVDFSRSLQNMEQRLPIPDFQMFASALRIAREIGGNLAEILERLSDTLRRKATMEGKIDALTAQGRMQGYVMTGLPVLLGFLLYLLEPEAMSKLFTDKAGWITLGVAITMEIMGYIFISKITAIDV
ncbi:MAG TPA: type II secretion system F family protein [Gammaproteobacteria bacterium]|nr:type II secretion system F family protein [Gammaproteobacteria bacterium]